MPTKEGGRSSVFKEKRAPERGGRRVFREAGRIIDIVAAAEVTGIVADDGALKGEFRFQASGLDRLIFKRVGKRICGGAAAWYNTVGMNGEPIKAYCISCGEEVPVKKVSLGIEGEELLQCVHCNSYLGTVSQPQTFSAPAKLPSGLTSPPAEKPADFQSEESAAESGVFLDMPADLVSFQEEDVGPAGEDVESGQPPLQTVMTVEDSTLISAILNEMLVLGGLTRRVIPCKNGYEFLARYIRERQARTNLGLVVMDVKMPVLNGVIAAAAMRAHEKAHQLEPVPILFFTSKRCDSVFRKVLLHCAPAMYINKGTSESPEHLQDRIGKVIRQLLKEEW